MLWEKVPSASSLVTVSLPSVPLASLPLPTELPLASSFATFPRLSPSVSLQVAPSFGLGAVLWVSVLKSETTQSDRRPLLPGRALRASHLWALVLWSFAGGGSPEQG